MLKKFKARVLGLNRTQLTRLAVFLFIGAFAYYIFYTQTNIKPNTAALYIGLPLLIALAVSYFVKPRSHTGMYVLVLTLFLIIVSIAAGVGSICIIMASPLFYGIVIVIGRYQDKAQREYEQSEHWEQDRKNRLKSGFLVALLVLLSLEGAHELTTFERETQVAVTEILDLPLAELEARVAGTPVITQDLPLFLDLGFPYPNLAAGEGAAIGDTRTFFFKDGSTYVRDEWKTDGRLVLEVIGSGPASLEFAFVRDDTKVSHWLRWQAAEYQWRAVSENRTEVTLVLTYERHLDPAWYFGPLQKYGVKKAGEYLLRNLGAPDV